MSTVKDNAWIDLRGIAHTLHAASRDHRSVSASDALSSDGDGLQATGANFVDGGSIGAGLQPSTKSNLSGRRLTDASLHDVTKVNFLDRLCRDVILLNSMLQGGDPKLSRGEGF